MTDAREYHDRSNHSPADVRDDAFSLDESIRPRPYKLYADRPRVDLDRIRPPQGPALATVAERVADPLAGADATPPDPPDRETVATLCYEASGVTQAVDADGETVRFRAASCTGKLYHVDLYLVCGDAGDLPAGVYHFDPDGFALDVLREGDYRAALADAAGGSSAVREAPLTVVATSTWWRNAWKYRERTYRHAFWDAGTVLANLLAASHALDYRAGVETAFADRTVAALLGVDTDEEAPLSLVPVGAGAPAPASPDVDPLDLETVPYSEATVDYPLIRDAYDASSVADGAAAAAWAGDLPVEAVGTRPPGDGERVPLDPVDDETASARPLAATVRRRRSCREYAVRPLGGRKLATILDRAVRGVPADWTPPSGTGLSLNDVYVLSTNTTAVPRGTYQYHPGETALERIGPATDGDKTRLAFGQGWAGDAHVNVYLATDVDAVVDRLGNRGYRLAQLEAGVVLGRLYLATYAHRDLGGTGLTFDDDAVADHLATDAARPSPTTMFALGVADD